MALKLPRVSGVDLRGVLGPFDIRDTVPSSGTSSSTPLGLFLWILPIWEFIPCPALGNMLQAKAPH